MEKRYETAASPHACPLYVRNITGVHTKDMVNNIAEVMRDCRRVSRSIRESCLMRNDRDPFLIHSIHPLAAVSERHIIMRWIMVGR
jgi:hypothetical protein